MKNCPECNKPLPKKAGACPFCSKQLKNSKEEEIASKINIPPFPKESSLTDAQKDQPQKKEVPQEINNSLEKEKQEAPFAPKKETIFLENKKTAPSFKKVFFIGGIAILILLVVGGAYFFLPKNSFQKLIESVPPEAVFFIALNTKSQDVRILEDSQYSKEFFVKTQNILSEKLEDSHIDIEKIRPFFGERFGLSFSINNKKLSPAYFLEIKSKKEVVKILDSSPALIPESYRGTSFYTDGEEKMILLLNDFLILTERTPAIKTIESIQEEKTISKNLLFKKMKRRLNPKNALLFGYFDATLFKQYLEDKNLKQYSHYLESFKAAGFVFGGKKTEGFIFSDDYSSMKPVFVSTTLKSVSPKTAFLVSGADLEENLTPLIKESDLYLSYFQNLIKKQGFSAEEVLPFLKKEFSFLISSSNQDSIYSFISEVEDVEAIKSKFKKIEEGLEQYFASEKAVMEVKTLPDGTKATYLKMPAETPKFQKENHQEIPIFSIKNGGKEIAYSFFSKKVFVSSNTSFLKEMLDLSKKREGTFLENKALPVNYHLLFYVNPSLLLETLSVLTEDIPQKTKDDLKLIPAFLIKFLFGQQGIIVEGEIVQ